MPSRRGVIDPTIAVVLSGLCLLACDRRPPPEAPPAEPDMPAAIPFAARFDVDGVYHLDPSLPLARRTTFAALKADEYDERRAADPEHYAVTAPPIDVARVRPMTEWEEMRALVFAYPSYAAQLDQATDTFVQIAKHASDFGDVWVMVGSSQAESIFTGKLASAGVPAEKIGTSIKIWRSPIDTYWFIDYGPLPLIDTIDGTYAFGDFRYYHDRPRDDAVPTVLGRNTTRFGEPFPATTYRLPLTVEGGTFQSTGDGVCITGSRQIYNMSCYAGSCKESILGLALDALQSHFYAVEMRALLAQYVGCKDLVVTHSLVEEVDTGHIDMYLKILDDDRILLGEYGLPFANDFQEENARLMNDNAAFLEAYVLPDGGRFQVVRLPMPGHRTVQEWFGSYDVPFTYINSTFFNGLNLWPAYTFGSWAASRDEAEAIWQQVLPDMQHVWIDSEELSYQAGAIHCVTRTIPKMKAHAWVDDGTCSDGTCASAGGYDGACSLSGASDLCWGPEWLCGCNDCSECPEVVDTEPCGDVGWRGCCDRGDVLFCDNARLQRLPCAGTGCGWDDGEGVYDCGLAGEDPTGATPAACDCAPACDGKTCGEDGCGGVCGTCADDSRCVAGNCRADCAECEAGEMGCDGTSSWRCVAGLDGCNSIERHDCAATGLTCDDGDCIAVPIAEIAEADPDPVEPDEVEAAGDTAEPVDTTEDTGPDAGASDSVTILEAEADAGGIARARDDGCKGGGAGGLALVACGLALAGLRRRARIGA